VVLIIAHGGAGRWEHYELKEAVKVLRRAVEIGVNELLKGGSALDAVVEAVTLMEASGAFNAGRGACKDSSGGVSLDAGVMWMERAGAVAHVKATWNAVKLARAVMEDTHHVLLVGDGADSLAKSRGMPPLEHCQSTSSRGVVDTVGAVALDSQGRLASAVSTGGIRGKMPGRVGDSPIPGAGFWVTKRVASCSTGVGEAIMMTHPCRMTSMLYEAFGVDLPIAVKASCEAVKAPCGVIALSIEGGAAAYTTADYMPISVATEEVVEVQVLEKKCSYSKRLAK